ncbi:ABC transporter permease [Anaerophilus nitritogenes]|uniref:ABC transporter permease n=1 Tax=Anaerophilus nitritogenes TaxID=2498136 RepID=UPI00101C492E|nr:ABC transporter permease subunit [Anaerophilus nitritogenes]
MDTTWIKNILIKRYLYSFEPVFHIIQATPPISWLALGIIWFGLDGKATVFIVFIVSIPIMIINIVEGFENIDPKLIEMARIFHFSKRDVLFDIIFPSLKSYFKSGITIAVGLGWKLVIMGEVLSSSTGIGAQITNARLNIETGKVLAWTIIVILLGVLSQNLIDFVFDFENKGTEHNDFTNEQNRKKFWKFFRIKRFFPKG